MSVSAVCAPLAVAHGQAISNEPQVSCMHAGDYEQHAAPLLACDGSHHMNVRGARTPAALYCCKNSNVGNWQTQQHTADRTAVTPALLKSRW